MFRFRATVSPFQCHDSFHCIFTSFPLLYVKLTRKAVQRSVLYYILRSVLTHILVRRIYDHTTITIREQLCSSYCTVVVNKNFTFRLRTTVVERCECLL